MAVFLLPGPTDANVRKDVKCPFFKKLENSEQTPPVTRNIAPKRGSSSGLCTNCLNNNNNRQTSSICKLPAPEARAVADFMSAKPKASRTGPSTSWTSPRRTERWDTHRLTRAQQLFTKAVFRERHTIPTAHSKWCAFVQELEHQVQRLQADTDEHPSLRTILKYT